MKKLLAALIAAIFMLGLFATPANAAAASKATVTCSSQRIFSVAGPELSLTPDGGKTKIHTLRFVKYAPCYNYKRKMSFYRVMHVEAHFSTNRKRFGKANCLWIRSMKARWNIYSKYGTYKVGVNVPCKPKRNEVKRGKNVRFDVYYTSLSAVTRHAGRWDFRGLPDTRLRVHTRLM